MPGGPNPPRISAAAWRVMLAIAVAVTLFLATTERELPVLDNLNDKLKHVAAFLGLSFLADYSLPAIPFGLRKILPLLGYGVLIEIVQHFLPWRDPSALDVIADAVGIAAYALSHPLLRRMPMLERR